MKQTQVFHSSSTSTLIIYDHAQNWVNLANLICAMGLPILVTENEYFEKFRHLG